MEEPRSSAIMKLLDWVYDKAVDGGIGGESAREMAESYMKSGTAREQANALIRWQVAKAGTSGFVTGVGGAITLPLALPANITSVLYVQLRMIAAIAHIGGHNPKDDRVRTLAYVCLCGSGAMDIAKASGIQIGTKLTTTALRRLSGETLRAINRKVGFRLLTKFGEKGALNLGKAVPLSGGVIGATADGIATNTIGNIARDTFVE